MPGKCVLILLDGLGDRAYRQLNRQTPLQAASTPNLDRLATMGASGLYHAATLGRALPSEDAHFAMFGYPAADFPGRGALEALGAGHRPAPDDVALLAHLVELQVSDGCLRLVTDQPLATAAEFAALTAAISPCRLNGNTITFLPHQTHRGGSGILLLEGTKLSPRVTDTNIMTEGRLLPAPHPWQEHADDPAARHTARLLADYLRRVHRQLAAHPVNEQRRREGRGEINGLVTQRGGRLQVVEDFHRHNGLRGLSISSGIVYWGLASFLGLAVERDHDGDEPGRDLARRLDIARQALPDFDFIHVHTKAPDQAAHAKDPLGKMRVIEALDRGLGEAIEPLLADPEVLLVITADHSTPSAGPLIHSGEPVPLTMVGEGIRVDGVNAFDEVAVAGGALGTVRSGELMALVINALDRAKLAGLRDHPADLPYWPGPCEPFKVAPPDGEGSDEQR